MQTENEKKSSDNWPMLLFADVEGIVAALHDVGDDDRPALKARLKQFARGGVPRSANVGSGRTVTYSFADLFQIALAFEFVQLFLTTDRAAALVGYWWPRELFKIPWLSYRASADPVVIILRLEGYDGLKKAHSIHELEALREKKSADEPRLPPTLGYGSFSKAFSFDGAYPVGNPHVFRRISLVNATGLTMRLKRVLEDQGLVDHETFHAACTRAPRASTMAHTE